MNEVLFSTFHRYRHSGPEAFFLVDTLEGVESFHSTGASAASENSQNGIEELH